MQFENLDEASLIKELKAGNELAFAEIFNRCQKFLKVQAYNRLKDKQEAEDIIQEVFASLWLKRANLSEEGSLKYYLFQIVRSKCNDLQDKKLTQRKYIHYSIHTNPHQATLPQNSIEAKELRDQISKAIENIASPRARQAFEMRYLEDKSLKSISVEMNIGLQVVRNQISRVLKTLRTSLDKQVD